MSLTEILSNFHISETTEEIYKNTIKASEIETPIGKLIAVADDNFLYILIKLKSPDKVINTFNILQKELSSSIVIGSTKIITQLENELTEYFSGKLKSFTIPMRCLGTDFRQQSWNQLKKIAYGETMSYGELAVKLGRNVNHARAVGSAAGANPIIILVPCHRLTAQNGHLGGFSCGIDVKTWLLQHESKFKNK
ncbi:O-6-alkylguanine-DNA alkyltransferase [Arctopsyche grandis]|uniref:O-6-alkylguanine-DNA alkyltransferase n=1 Tax=Arctopsyche grandis TaxID=121162 RepID=UPI00406D8E9A